MSRILDALKRAMPRLEDKPAAASAKPLIFEKVSFETPDPQALQREIEAKKESARLRYLLNEPRRSGTDDSQRFLWALGAMLGASLLAVALLWPKPHEFSPEKVAQAYERAALLEADLSEKNSELERLKAALAAGPSADSAKEESEAARAEIGALNRKLAVMLEDNLRKDEEIARLSAGRSSERILD